jgi:23S rRNA (guanosine2251-2'-O)-methyltransferase
MGADWDFPQDSANSDKLPLVFVLDSIRSLSNVGSIFRTADSLGLQAVFLCGFTGQPPNREIEKTALGACESVFWMHFPEISSCLSQLKEKGYQLIALEQQSGSVALQDFSSSAPLAVVLGNEIHGVSPEVLQQVDQVVEIPQFGIKKSLNVAVSAGMLAWEIRASRLRKS